MGGKGLLVASVVLAVLAGGVYWSERQKKTEDAKPPADAAPKLIATAEDKMRRIELRKKDAPPVVLQRARDKKWEIAAPVQLPADQDAISSIANALSGLTWDALVEEKSANLADFGLVSPALEVEMTDDAGKRTTMAVGDENPTGSAFFAKIAGDPRIFTIFNSTKSSFDKTAQDLRDKRLLTFDSSKLVRVELNAKGQAIEFGKNNQNEWQILRPRPLRADSLQVDELVRKLGDARMDTSTSEEDAKKAPSLFASGSPLATARVTDASGTQTLEVRKSKDDYYARSSAVAGVFKISADAGQAVAKTLDDFRNKKLFDFGFDDPASFEIRDGDKLFRFQKKDSDWTMNGKKVDATRVQQLIDKLRDLSSIKFVEEGYAPPPMMEIAVTSNGGKRIEKVTISKNASNAHFAKRENEPATYELDGAIVNGIRTAANEMK